MLYFSGGAGGCEKLHGAVVEHSGRSDTRVFREVSQIGAELARLGDQVVGATVEARVGILFDWDNWHAVEDAVGPIRDKRYYDTVARHYLAFYRQNVAVDVVFPDSDFSKYSVLVAPMLYMVKPGFAEKVEAFVSGGGTFVTTYLSGLVDETELAFENGYPGALANVLGIWVEEIDALYESQTNRIVMADGSGTYSCSRLADLLHAGSAEVVATYGEDFYQGMPVVTRNSFGAGEAYYLASDPDDAFLNRFYGEIAAKHGIAPALNAPGGVEVAVRQKDNSLLCCVLNHTAESVTIPLDGKRFTNLLGGETVDGVLALAGYDVAILAE
ncbi:MAG: beta-galactosidase trimerization domain-containing protein [Anaerolineae bacterium]